MSRQTEIDPDALLQHAGFIRAIARGLLLHPDEADDIVQETLMAALRRPPQDQTKLRAWLGAVGRKIALKRRRSDGRRPRREKEAARRESLASTAEVAAQLELQRQVVTTVMELDEPYRSTIVHRYFHDRTPTEIAQALDVSVKTVESRLTRALKQLRGRLDQTHGRRGWSAALLPLALPRTEAAAATTVFVMSAKAVVAALVVGVVLTVWAVVSADRSGPEEQARSAANGPGFAANVPAWPEVQSSQGPERTRNSDGSTMRSGGATSDAVRRGAQEEAEALTGPCKIRGVIRLSEGATVEGVKVWMQGYAVYPNTKLIRRDTETKADGSYEFAQLPAGAYQIHAEYRGHAPFVSGHHYLVSEKHPELGGLAGTLTRGATLRVRLTDGARRLTDRSVTLFTKPPRKQRTDAQGEAVWRHLAQDRYTVRFRDGGTVYERTQMVRKDKDALIEFVVDKVVRGTVTVRGRPKPDAKVLFMSSNRGQVAIRADSQGRYEVKGLNAGLYLVLASGPGFAATAIRVEVGSAMISEHSFALGASSVSGRVLGVLGGASVSLRGRSRLIATVDDEGRFAFFNLRHGEYDLSVRSFTSGVRALPQNVTVAPGGKVEGITFRLAPTRRGTVELTILGPDGDLIEKSVQFYVGLDNGASTSMIAQQKTPGRHTLELLTGRRSIRMQLGALRGEIEVDVRPNETISRTVRLR